MKEILLTIAIPTYNRSALLDICLSSLTTQLKPFEDKVELLVSNNASQDDTRVVVDRYAGTIKNFKYFENAENVGPDLNIRQCFVNSAGSYVWIFSDDDFLMPNYFEGIVKLLDAREVGVVHLSSVWYTDSEIPAFPHVELQYKEFSNPILFIEHVHYWVTFITGNIVNKGMLGNSISLDEFNGTSLTQLAWVIPAIFLGKKNTLVSTNTLACKANNTGGYKLFEVFGKNFNFIMDKMIERKVINSKVKRIINNRLLTEFFPAFVRQHGASFESEGDLFVLLKVFWNYKNFWTVLFPLFVKKIANLKPSLLEHLSCL